MDDRESINCFEQTVNRNLNFENAASESSEESEAHILETVGSGNFVMK